MYWVSFNTSARINYYNVPVFSIMITGIVKKYYKQEVIK